MPREEKLAINRKLLRQSVTYHAVVLRVGLEMSWFALQVNQMLETREEKGVSFEQVK